MIKRALAIAALPGDTPRFAIVSERVAGRRHLELTLVDWDEAEALSHCEGLDFALAADGSLWLTDEDEIHACYGTARVYRAGKVFVLHAAHPFATSPWVWLCPMNEFAVPLRREDGTFKARFSLV